MLDKISLALAASRVQSKALGIAADARAVGAEIRKGGLVDEAMLIHRVQLLDGLAQVQRDDLVVISAAAAPFVAAPPPAAPVPVPERHPHWLGRWCETVARVLTAVAGALR